MEYFVNVLEVNMQDLNIRERIVKFIETLPEVKYSNLYSKKAILCKATDVLPDPAIPCTIIFELVLFLITWFCSC